MNEFYNYHEAVKGDIYERSRIATLRVNDANGLCITPGRVIRQACICAWTQDGLHLMISDAGTPGYYEDDFICDWETNRDFTITVND